MLGKTIPITLFFFLMNMTPSKKLHVGLILHNLL